MHDPVNLFKILIVVLIVVYQAVQALRKRARTQASSEIPQAPEFEPEAAPEPKREDTLSRIRTLVLGRAPSRVVFPTQAAETPKPPVVAAETGIDPMPPRQPERVLKIPTLQDLVLAQMILSPPPGLRGGNQTGRSPLEFRR